MSWRDALEGAPRGAARKGKRGLRNPGVTAAKWAARVVWLMVVALLALISLSQGAPILAVVLAGVGLSIMIRSALPDGALQKWSQELISGEAGERSYKSARDRLK